MTSVPDDDELYEVAYQLGRRLTDQGSWLAIAESCTGGWLGKILTDVKGSSHWFDRGFITYTNQAKHELLGVSEETLAENGAVSEATALEMARGVIAHSHADYSVAITGIAGPGGASHDKPLGTVWLAWAGANDFVHSECYHFQGNREQVRRQAVQSAALGVIKHCLK
ncbi:MAG: CinA family protein [Thioalkalispiraceae bacterium]|jgi:nicotinamide-nucleotide amidase